LSRVRKRATPQSGRQAVYGMHVERVYSGGCLQLIFSPIDEPELCPS
jgi:hypothetical protein